MILKFSCQLLECTSLYRIKSNWQNVDRYDVMVGHGVMMSNGSSNGM